MKQLDINYVIKKFPALNQDFIFMDNAGGSQILKNVTDRLTEYLYSCNVQLGASYRVSEIAGEKLEETTTRIARYMNASRPEEVVAGPSTSMLLRILSICISKQWEKGDEVIVTNSDHEANVSCWNDLQKQGIVVKTWRINPATYEFETEDLKKLLSSKTRLVAMVHTSNILGTINPIQEISKIVHKAGALFCVDGVAYAPHRLIDVRKWDVDFYAFSTYKVYGPHYAVLYGKYDLLREMEGINHYFITKEEVPYKFQPGNFNFELMYSLHGIIDYLEDLYDDHFNNSGNKTFKEKQLQSFELIKKHEENLSKKLIDYLQTNNKITIIGHQNEDGNKRVPTISFVHQDMKSSEIVEKTDPFRIGIRFGDFYAKRIIEDLGLVEKDGVVRVSMVHYNTLEEVDKLIKAFETIID